jgi:hypothetical protein
MSANFILHDYLQQAAMYTGTLLVYLRAIYKFVASMELFFLSWSMGM